MMPRSKVHLNPLRWLFSHSRLTILMVREIEYYDQIIRGERKGGGGGDLNAMSSYGGPAWNVMMHVSTSLSRVMR